MHNGNYIRIQIGKNIYALSKTSFLQNLEKVSALILQKPYRHLYTHRVKLLIFFTHDRLYRSFNELNYLEDIKRFYPNVEVVLTYLKSDNDTRMLVAKQFHTYSFLLQIVTYSFLVVKTDQIIVIPSETNIQRNEKNKLRIILSIIKYLFWTNVK